MWRNASENARVGLLRAQNLAEELGENCVTTAHLLKAMLTMPQSRGFRVLVSILNPIGLSPDDLEIEFGFEPPPGYDTNSRMSEVAQKCLDLAKADANAFGSDKTSTVHWLLAFSQYPESLAGHSLLNVGITMERVREAVETPGIEVLPDAELEVVMHPAGEFAGGVAQLLAMIASPDEKLRRVFGAHGMDAASVLSALRNEEQYQSASPPA